MGKVNETKERLRELHSLSSGVSSAEIRFSYPGDAGLSTIREGIDNSAASILSVSDIDLTDDALDQDESRLRSGRSFRKRKSEEGYLDISSSKTHKSDIYQSQENILTAVMDDLNRDNNANTSLPSAQDIIDNGNEDVIRREKPSIYPLTPRPAVKDY